MSDSVFDNSVTGRPEEVLSIVLRKISAHTRENVVRWFKIGITNNPKRRFNEQKESYDEMIVIYRSSSELADNFITGGGGRSGAPPYFMYIVVKY